MADNKECLSELLKCSPLGSESIPGTLEPIHYTGFRLDNEVNNFLSEFPLTRVKLGHRGFYKLWDM